MTFTLTRIKPTKARVDILGVFLFQGEKKLKDAVTFLPPVLKNQCLNFAKKNKFLAKKNQTLTFLTHDKIAAPIILLIGLGQIKKTKEESEKIIERLREASAILIKTASRYQAEKVGLILPSNTSLYPPFVMGDESGVLNFKTIGQAIAEGSLLGDYEFEKYKKTKKHPAQKKEIIILIDNIDLMIGIKYGEIISKAVVLARDLINEPAAQTTPHYLLTVAENIAAKSDLIELQSFGRTAIKKLGFHGLLAVAQGSEHSPYLIHLIYRPKVSQQIKKIAIIGKGITFDSGGLSLKDAEYMENMKIDMAGAAAVLGLFSIIADLKPQVEVHGLMGVCENMPGPKAIKPGDIIRIKNGKTVEIINTDAEGRVVLADVLSYAVEQKVDEIIDLATLTGACIVALGEQIAAVLGNNQNLIDKILTASKKTGEKIWQLPLEQSYKSGLKGTISDLRNTSLTKGGGTIMGALFLSYFVGKTPWVHLDIAGPAWGEKSINAYTTKGGVGFGVRTLVEYLKN